MLFRPDVRAISIRSPKALVHGAPLEILFHADYSKGGLGHEAQHLFSEERLFDAVWDDDAELFIPTSSSHLSAADVDTLFSDGDKEFFYRHRTTIEGLLDSEVKERRFWAEDIYSRYDNGSSSR